MLPYRDSRLTRVLLGVLFIIIVGYAYFEIRGLLYGPRIHVPEAVMQVDEQYIVLKGKADRIATLSMNGSPINVTEDGAFEEPYLLSPGLNRIVLDAEDKYGLKRQEVLQVVYTPKAGTSALPDTATTSPVMPLAPVSP